MWDRLLGLLDMLPVKSVWHRLITPVKVDVRSFRYESVENKPDDQLVILAAHPRRYRAAVRLTNRTDRVVVVAGIRVTIDKCNTHSAARTSGKVTLSAHDYEDLDISFHIGDATSATERGRYELFISPTVGRQARVEGHFPTEAV